MTERSDLAPCTLPLTRNELVEGARYGLYVLAEDLMAHHAANGGQVIPSGRVIFVPPAKADIPDDVVYRTHYLLAHDVAASGKRKRRPVQVNPQGGRILVVPEGKEQEWLGIARTLTRGRALPR